MPEQDDVDTETPAATSTDSATVIPSEMPSDRPGARSARMDSRKIAAAHNREMIIDAARTLFGRNGFERTSINDIAGVAEVSPGTIYLHFRNKEDLLASVIRESRPVSALPALADGRPEDMGGGDYSTMAPADFFARVVQLAVDETAARAEFLASMAFEARRQAATRQHFYESVLARPMRVLDRFLTEYTPTAHLPAGDRRLLSHLVIGTAVFAVLEQQTLGGDVWDSVELARLPQLLSEMVASYLESPNREARPDSRRFHGRL